MLCLLHLSSSHASTSFGQLARPHSALRGLSKIGKLVSTSLAQALHDRAVDATAIVVWVVALVLLGVLAWVVPRSKAPAPSMTEAQPVAGGRKTEAQAVAGGRKRK